MLNNNHLKRVLVCIAQYDLHFVTCIMYSRMVGFRMFHNTAILLVEKLYHMTRSRDFNFFIDITTLVDRNCPLPTTKNKNVWPPLNPNPNP